jgi:cell division protease FtsH
LTTEALERARATLHHNSEKIQALVARLLTAEVIEEEEITKILGPKVTSPTALWSKDQGQPIAAHEPQANPAPASMQSSP